MFGPKKINVNIDVRGDVINSEITGISVVSENGKVTQFSRHSLFTSIFIEYLGFPSFQELRFDFDLWSAKKRGRAKVYQRVRELWHDVRNYHVFLDDAITLSDVQLTEFVTRNPGYAYDPFPISSEYFDAYSVYYGDSYKIYRETPPSYTWMDFARLRDGSTRFLGLGDVRFGQIGNDLYLLNMVSKGTGEWIDALDNPNGKLIAKAAKRLKNYYSVDYMKEQIELGRKLYGFSQFLAMSQDDVDQISLGGFPVLVTSEVYSKIAEPLREFGAVALQSLTGLLVPTPHVFQLGYQRGLPKCCLLLGSRKQLERISKPDPTICAAWTLANNKSSEQTFYLQWMFKVGLKDWYSQIQHSVEVIDKVMEKIGYSALFEFDEERNWFGSFTPFTPKVMRDLFQMMKQKTYNTPLEIPIEPAGTPIITIVTSEEKKNDTNKELPQGGGFYVITNPCIGVKDASCVDVCPVDCIHPAPNESEFDTAEMLYINPDECISCGACEPACPVNAIFEESTVPSEWKHYIKINAEFFKADQ